MNTIGSNLIIKILEKENRWLTFDELLVKVQPDCDWVAFAAQLEQLVAQGDIQYALPSGADVGCYGHKELRNLPI